MKNLKRLGLSFTLMSVLAVAAIAGETPTPPCAPPDPGETTSPPCAAAQMTPGETNSPPASNAGDTTSEVVMDILQSVLLLF